MAAESACPAQLSLAFNASWLPYIEVTADDIQGTDIELIRQAMRRMGSQLVLIKTPEKRALQYIQQGKVDMLFAASFTPQRAAYAWFSQPYRMESNAVLVHGDLIQKYPELQQKAEFFKLVQKRLVGVYNPSGYYGEEFEQLKALTVVKNRSLSVYEPKRRLEIIQNKRADYSLVDRHAVQYVLDKVPGHAALQLLPFVLNEAAIHVMFSKVTVTAACVERFNQALKSP